MSTKDASAIITDMNKLEIDENKAIESGIKRLSIDEDPTEHTSKCPHCKPHGSKYECFLCGAEFIGRHFHYTFGGVEKNFCSIVCFRAVRFEDIAIETKEEDAKRKAQAQLRSGSMNWGGSVH